MDKSGAFKNKVAIKERDNSTGDIPSTPAPENQVKPLHGIVKVRNLPYGLCVKSMILFFDKFGDLFSVHMSPSRPTGPGNGFALVEYSKVEVAKFVSETLNTTSNFKSSVIIAKPPKPGRHRYEGGFSSKSTSHSKKIKVEGTIDENINLMDATHIQKHQALMSSIQENLRQLNELGIEYCFESGDNSNFLHPDIVPPNFE